MGFNTAADKFWRWSTWLAMACIMVGITWLFVASKTPDMPFAAWLAGASRDDVWLFAFGCIVSGVTVGRLITRR